MTAGMTDVIQDMKTSATRLMGIVNDFLNITTVKVGTSILNISSISLKPATEDILEELKPEIAKMDLTVTYPKEESAWPKLKIDAGKLREAIFIVMENAVRYNRPGGSIRISTEAKPDSFELVVENTGIGITPEESAKIGSSLFYRSQEARQNHPIGMGIGLSVVKAMVKAHRGTVSIESKGKGEGARVVVRIAK
jgi:two-component system phosphate regulon sensor histidine kinase PhoR